MAAIYILITLLIINWYGVLKAFQDWHLCLCVGEINELWVDFSRCCSAKMSIWAYVVTAEAQQLFFRFEPQHFLWNVPKIFLLRLDLWLEHTCAFCCQLSWLRFKRWCWTVFPRMKMFFCITSWIRLNPNPIPVTTVFKPPKAFRRTVQIASDSLNHT